MFPTGIDYNQIRRAGDIPAQKAAFIGQLGGLCAAVALSLDMLGPEAGRAFASEKHLLGVPKLLLPDTAEIKAYLQSSRPLELVGPSKWMVPSDTASLNTSATIIAGIYRTGLPAADLGYTRLFRPIDMRSSTSTSFKLVDTQMGWTWDQVAEGGEIKIRRLETEGAVDVSYVTYGDGFSVLDDWARFNQWYEAEERASNFIASYFHKKASRHYTLITTLGAGINVAFSVDHATTFNAAAGALLTGLETLGYMVPENPGLKILVRPENAGRVMALLMAQQGSLLIHYGTMAQPIAFSVDEVIVSTHVDVGNHYYLIYPGHKLVRADWKDFGTETERDAAKRAVDVYGSGQYNAAVGNSSQVKRVALQ